MNKSLNLFAEECLFVSMFAGMVAFNRTQPFFDRQSYRAESNSRGPNSWKLEVSKDGFVIELGMGHFEKVELGEGCSVPSVQSPMRSLYDLFYTGNMPGIHQDSDGITNRLRGTF